MQYKNKERIPILDILRGIAVALMVLAHTIAFIYVGNSSLLAFFMDFGNTVCFTIFLFTSGASSYIAYTGVKEQDWSIKKKSLAKRLGGLITGYYFVAFISSTGNIESIQDILKILFLIEIPGYTEFLLPFILFGTIILSGRNPIRKIVRTFPSTLIFSIFFFVLGNTVFDLNISGGMQPYISIIAGSDSLYRFPLLQYSPVFLLGLYFGKLINRKGHSIRTISIPYILTLLILVSTHFITPKIYHLNTFDRWPPSIAFLSAGLLVSFFMIYFSSYFEEYNSIKPLVKLGKTALGIYIWHDIILQINAKVFKFETDSHFLILTAFGTILLVSFGIVTLYRHIRYK